MAPEIKTRSLEQILCKKVIENKHVKLMFVISKKRARKNYHHGMKILPR
jgi:hypothetical protein